MAGRRVISVVVIHGILLLNCAQIPKKKKEKGRKRPGQDAEEWDETVTVVCSRYERRRKPVSLIRTCQEPVV
jgi:hypothetical protein